MFLAGFNCGHRRQRKPRQGRTGLRLQEGFAQRGLSLAMGGLRLRPRPVRSRQSSRLGVPANPVIPSPRSFLWMPVSLQGISMWIRQPGDVTDRPRARLKAAGVNSHYI